MIIYVAAMCRFCLSPKKPIRYRHFSGKKGNAVFSYFLSCLKNGINASIVNINSIISLNGKKDVILEMFVRNCIYIIHQHE